MHIDTVIQCTCFDRKAKTMTLLYRLAYSIHRPYHTTIHWSVRSHKIPVCNVRTPSKTSIYGFRSLVDHFWKLLVTALWTEGKIVHTIMIPIFQFIATIMLWNKEDLRDISTIQMYSYYSLIEYIHCRDDKPHKLYIVSCFYYTPVNASLFSQRIIHTCMFDF